MTTTRWVKVRLLNTYDNLKTILGGSDEDLDLDLEEEEEEGLTGTRTKYMSRSSYGYGLHDDYASWTCE